MAMQKSFRPDPPPEIERPGALAGATGANVLVTGDSAKNSKSPRARQPFRPPERHRRVARFIGYALSAGDADLFVDGAVVLVRHLTPAERTQLAFLAMLSLPRSAAAAVADATVPDRTGPDPAPDPDHDADPWNQPWVVAEFARWRADRDRRQPLTGGRR
jgi:hypothetical protein